MKNEIMIFEGKWLELEIIMTRKITQTQPHTMFSLMYKTYIQMYMWEKEEKGLKKKNMMGKILRKWGEEALFIIANKVK